MRRPDGGELTVTALPAVHGPEDGERDGDGFVNCEVIGFILSGPDVPTVYVSGDNASIRVVAEIARRAPAIDAVVLHAGAARVQSKFGGRPLTLDGIRAAAVAAVLDQGPHQGEAPGRQPVGGTRIGAYWWSPPGFATQSWTGSGHSGSLRRLGPLQRRTR